MYAMIFFSASLKQCPNDCNIGSSQGSCNYITGVCVCVSGWSGTDCNTAVTSTASGASRKCVQCNSEIDSECSTSRTNVDCPVTEAYCSTRTSTIIDGFDAVIRIVTTKACTSAFKAVDQCVFNDIHTDRQLAMQLLVTSSLTVPLPVIPMIATPTQV
uniref:EGF-like domain-containing protein comC n=1 Tax=Styela clava TaxID=7725 RepID=UPI001939E4A3|nr:EGF-like domain-containing protein comC [Styela clava]